MVSEFTFEYDEENPNFNTSEIWQLLYPYPKVVIPHGWNRTDKSEFIHEWYEEKIDLSTYQERVAKSFVIESKKEK